MKTFLEYLLESREADPKFLNTLQNDKEFNLQLVPKKNSKNVYKGLVDTGSRIERYKIMKALAEKYNGIILGRDSGRIGYIKFPHYDLTLYIKPNSALKLAGVDSELSFVKLIKQRIENSDDKKINIRFISKYNKFSHEINVTDIVDIKHTGKLATGNNGKIKADIQLIRKNQKPFNISLKKVGAIWVGNWSSQHTYDEGKAILDKAIKDKKITISKREDENYVLSNVAYWKMTNDEKQFALFGEDCLSPNGCVIVGTFDDEKLFQETEIQSTEGIADSYDILVEYIITSDTMQKDLKNKHDIYWFAINHAGRPGPYRGIYLRAGFGSRINSNSVQIR